MSPGNKTTSFSVSFAYCLHIRSDSLHCAVCQLNQHAHTHTLQARKLEFLLADALQQGCDCVVTFGGIPSNHARATSLAARQLGLQTHLVVLCSREMVSEWRGKGAGPRIGRQNVREGERKAGKEKGGTRVEEGRLSMRGRGGNVGV